MMLLATLLHLDRFHLNSPDLNAQVAAWAWLIVYIAVPFILLTVLFVQLRTPGGDPPKMAEIPQRIRLLIGVNAAISLVVGLALFFIPESVFPLWPWQLTPLTAQGIGAGFFAVVAASVQFLRENSWSRSRSGTVSYLMIGGLQLLALLRFPNTVEWSRPGTWLYIVFMTAILIGGLYSTITAWRRNTVSG